MSLEYDESLSSLEVYRLVPNQLRNEAEAILHSHVAGPLGLSTTETEFPLFSFRITPPSPRIHSPTADEGAVHFDGDGGDMVRVFPKVSLIRASHVNEY